MVLTGLVGTFGTEALAGWNRLKSRVFNDSFNLRNRHCNDPIVGANIGAKNIKRAEMVGIYGGTSTGIISIFIGLMLAIFPDAWIQFFTDDVKAFEVTKLYIQIVGPFIFFKGLVITIFRIRVLML